MTFKGNRRGEDVVGCFQECGRKREGREKEELRQKFQMYQKVVETLASACACALAYQMLATNERIFFSPPLSFYYGWNILRDTIKEWAELIRQVSSISGVSG